MLDRVVSVCIHRHVHTHALSFIFVSPSSPHCHNGSCSIAARTIVAVVLAAMEQRGLLKKVREEGSVSNFRSLLKYRPQRGLPPGPFD